MSITLYAAGNFVLMNNPEKEKKFIDEVTKRTGTCNRLISFFFKKEMKTITDIQNGIEPKPKLIRRKKSEPKNESKSEPKSTKKYDLVVDGKTICSGLTEQEIWKRIEKYNGIAYFVIDPETGGYAEAFLPF